MTRRATAALVLLGVVAVLWAQDQSDDSIFGSSDDLFGGSALVTEIEESEEDLSISLLTTENVTIGGRYGLDLSAGYGWDDISAMGDTLFTPDTEYFTTSLSTQIFLDARPADDFRVFAKMTASSPFSTWPDDPADPLDTSRDLEDVFHVEELFSDFNWGDRVFLRGGKQTMNWGVGYFYSPADLLSISELDPQDPDAERQGPIALKANAPIRADNLYFYLLPEYASVIQETGVALKYELVLPGAELTFGGIYQTQIAPAAMATVAASLGDVEVFAEGVLSYGSNRTFVRESATVPLGLETFMQSDTIFASGTVGGSWRYSAEASDTSLLILAQYLYNGEGYEDQTIVNSNPGGTGALLAAGDLQPSDLTSRGRHYSAARISLSDISGTGVSIGVFWMQNYSDLSARIVPSVGTTLFDTVAVSLQGTFSLGDAGDEFSPTGNAFAAGLAVSLGTGEF